MPSAWHRFEMGMRRWLRHLVPHRYHPRFVRRTHVVCPGTGESVQIDVEMGVQPDRRQVLRCSLHPDGRVPCGQECLRDPAVWEGPADALLILPPGRGVPDEQD